MIPIPYALTYKTTLHGRAPKLVQCDQCNFEYVYLLEMAVTAQDTSLFFLDNEGARQRSTSRAELALQQNLARGCEAIPCPRCGAVQLHMFPRARERHLRWMRTVGLIALAAGGVLALPAAVYILIDLAARTGITTLTVAALTGVAAAWSVGFGLLILRKRLCSRYDPNSTSVEDRRRLGLVFAISKEEFLKDSGDA